VPVRNSASGPPIDAIPTLIKSAWPLEGAEHGVENAEITMMVRGTIMAMRWSARFWLRIASPLQMVTGGQMHVMLHAGDGFFHGRSRSRRAPST